MLVWEHRWGVCGLRCVCPLAGRSVRPRCCWQIPASSCAPSSTCWATLSPQPWQRLPRPRTSATSLCRPVSVGPALGAGLCSAPTHKWGGRNGAAGVHVPCNIPAFLVLGTGVYAPLHHPSSSSLDGDIHSASPALPSAHCPGWFLRVAAAPVHHSAASGEPEGAIHPTHAQFAPPDTEYINPEELAKVEKMLNHLSEESKQAAATTLVSPPRAPALSQSLTAGLGHRTLDVTLTAW